MKRILSTFGVIVLLTIAIHCRGLGCPVISLEITAPAEGSKATLGITGTEKDLNCSATVSPTSYASQIAWTCQAVGEGTTISWPEGQAGANVKLRYTGLPNLNSSFGQKWIKATVENASDTNHFKLFFSKSASNNPNGANEPNWFYYWKQITAVYKSPIVFCEAAGEGATGWNSQTSTWVAAVGSAAATSGYPDQGPLKDTFFEGIDKFAYSCRHEAAHYQACTQWFPDGQTPYSSDDDGIPDNVETSYGTAQGGPFVVGLWDTDGDGQMDQEDLVYFTCQSWTPGSANSEDWANPGHQY